MTKKTIFVNEPLRYDGMTFYQTDWNIVNVQAILNNKKVLDIPLQEINVSNNSRFWIGSLGEKTKILIVNFHLSGKYHKTSPHSSPGQFLTFPAPFHIFSNVPKSICSISIF